LVKAGFQPETLANDGNEHINGDSNPNLSLHGVETPVVAMKKSIPGKTPKEAASEESGSGSGDSGFRGLLEGRFGADDPLEKKMCLLGPNWMYIFKCRKAKKLIQDKVSRRRSSNRKFRIIRIIKGGIDEFGAK
jgi:hypothetical protein